MKNDVSSFVEWFERERESIMDRLFKVLEENLYDDFGCGLVMEPPGSSLRRRRSKYPRLALNKGLCSLITPLPVMSIVIPRL